MSFYVRKIMEFANQSPYYIKGGCLRNCRTCILCYSPTSYANRRCVDLDEYHDIVHRLPLLLRVKNCRQYIITSVASLQQRETALKEIKMSFSAKYKISQKINIMETSQHFSEYFARFVKHLNKGRYAPVNILVKDERCNVRYTISNIVSSIYSPYFSATSSSPVLHEFSSLEYLKEDILRTLFSIFKHCSPLKCHHMSICYAYKNDSGFVMYDSLKISLVKRSDDEKVDPHLKHNNDMITSLLEDDTLSLSVAPNSSDLEKYGNCCPEEYLLSPFMYKENDVYDAMDEETIDKLFTPSNEEERVLKDLQI